MATDDVVLRAARNAYLGVLLALVGVSVYQFVTLGTLVPAITVIWVVAAGGFYVSKYYYGRATTDGSPDAEESTADGGEGN